MTGWHNMWMAGRGGDTSPFLGGDVKKGYCGSAMMGEFVVSHKM
jgi:hypothetical protein